MNEELKAEILKAWRDSMPCMPECKNGEYEDIGCPAHGIDAINTWKYFDKALTRIQEASAREARKEGYVTAMRVLSENKLPKIVEGIGVTLHICCDGECNHDDCCGKVKANCPLALQDNK